MLEKGLLTFQAVLVEFVGISVPLALAGIIDMVTLPVRLIVALFVGP